MDHNLSSFPAILVALFSLPIRRNGMAWMVGQCAPTGSAADSMIANGWEHGAMSAQHISRISFRNYLITIGTIIILTS